MRPATPRCPDCGSIDWYRDGCVIAAPDLGADPTLSCGRFQRSDPALVGAMWSCSQCAHEVPGGSTLERDLDAIRSATCHEATVA